MLRSVACLKGPLNKVTSLSWKGATANGLLFLEQLTHNIKSVNKMYFDGCIFLFLIPYYLIILRIKIRYHDDFSQERAVLKKQLLNN